MQHNFIQKFSELKAVILADSYETKFFPLSQDMPKALFPLCNIPIIEYNIQWLYSNGIKEIIVLYQSKSERIENHFKKQKKQKYEVKLLSTQQSQNLGDALRELYSSQLMHSDFLLIQGDIITNIPLRQLIDSFYKRKEESKLNIMTMCVERADKSLYIYTTNSTNQLLQIDRLDKKVNLKFTTDFITVEKGFAPNTHIYSNLRDAEIYVCSHDVLSAFQENFTFENIKDDFLREIMNSEIKEERIHLYMIEGQYGSARIRNIESYFQVTSEVIKRVFYPQLPANYTYEDINKYIGNKVQMSQSSSISNCCQVGHNSILEKNVRVVNSVIGQNCVLKQNCKVYNCILWDGCEIAEDCVIQDSILGQKVIVGEGTYIQKSIIQGGVKVRPNVRLPEFSKLTQLQKEDDPFCVKGSIQKVEQQENFVQDDVVFQHFLEDKSLLGEITQEDQDSQQIVHNKKEDFFTEEVFMLIQDADNDEKCVEQAQVQVQAMKLNYNKNFDDCISVISRAIFSKLLQTQQLNDQEKLKSIQLITKTWQPLLIKFLTYDDEQAILIKEIEDFCRVQQEYKEFLHLFLQISFQNKLLNGKVIINWAEKLQQDDDENSKLFIQLVKQAIVYNIIHYQTKKFVDWLQQQEEDDDEEDEEEDGEGDDENENDNDG